ncbi:MAG: hypothetical protein PHC52_14005 [Syntrophales bacterium]|nr:hypothetical protein [Syntrophales bacterium]
MTVRQLERNIDSYELQEWAAFFKITRSKDKGPVESDQLKDQLKAAFAGAKAKARRVKRR